MKPLVGASLVALAGCGARAGLESGGTTAGSGGASTAWSGGSTSLASGTSTTSTTGGTSTTGSGGGGGNCQPGDPAVQLVAGGATTTTIALDAAFVYFEIVTGAGCQATPRLVRVPKLGGAVAPVGNTQRRSGAIAVDDTRVYISDDPVSECTDPVDQGFQILAWPKAGGGKPLAFAFGGELSPALDIALDDTHVYWLADNIVGVKRAAKGGGAPEVVAMSGMPHGIGIALFGDSVFWTSPVGVARVPKAGGVPTELAMAPPQAALGGLAADATGVYFVGSEPCQGQNCGIIGSVRRVALTGGTQAVIESGTEESPQRVAIDESHVYWTLTKAPPALSGAVMRADKAGGNVVTIATGQAPQGIALDDACVYWSDVGDGSIWRAPK